jgi:uncharacterized membrane protein
MSTSGVWYFTQWFHYLALSLWIGGITFLSAVAAPAAHRSIASRAVAGQIVGTILKRLNILEILCFLILVTTSFFSFRFIREKQNCLWYLILVILVMGILTLFYSFYLTPKLEAVKASVPTFDSLSPDHAAKIEFNRLHKLYVQLMSLNLVLGLAVLYGSVVVLK